MTNVQRFVILSETKDLQHSSNTSTFSSTTPFCASSLADPSLSFRMTPDYSSNVLMFSTILSQDDKRFVILSATKDLQHSSNTSTFSRTTPFCASSLADPSLSFRMTNTQDLQHNSNTSTFGRTTPFALCRLQILHSVQDDKPFRMTKRFRVISLFLHSKISIQDYPLL